MRAPFAGNVYLGRIKPSATEVMLERAIGCGERPLLCYKIGCKWAYLLYASTLTDLRVPVVELGHLFRWGRARSFTFDTGPERAQSLRESICKRAERFAGFDVGFSKIAVREAIDALEAFAKEAEPEPGGEGAAHPEVPQADDARPDEVHSQGEG